MKRSDLEHLIRAAAAITEDDEIIIVGSQSILGQFPDAPAPLRVSMEADLYPKNHPDRWELIDGSLGEESPFHQTFGYYAQGVDVTTSVLPDGWRDRLTAIHNANTRGATGWTLDVHDVVIAKLVAGREKDQAFAEHAVRARLADIATLEDRLAATPLDERVRARVAGDLRTLRR